MPAKLQAGPVIAVNSGAPDFERLGTAAELTAGSSVDAQRYVAPAVERIGTAAGLTAGVSNSGFGDATSLIT